MLNPIESVKGPTRSEGRLHHSKDAEEYARTIQTTIVLMDGAQLAELMNDHGVVVTPVKRYEIKRVDSDYFTVE